MNGNGKEVHGGQGVVSAKGGIEYLCHQQATEEVAEAPSDQAQESPPRSVAQSGRPSLVTVEVSVKVDMRCNFLLGR